jgi:hypothetical protein
MEVQVEKASIVSMMGNHSNNGTITMEKNRPLYQGHFHSIVT